MSPNSPQHSPQRQPLDRSFASDVTVVSAEESPNLINLQAVDTTLHDLHAAPSPTKPTGRPASTLQPLPKGAMSMPAPQSVYLPVSTACATDGGQST